MAQDRFWETTRLAEMNEAQWEALCDGCGKCCLIKLHDEETNDIVFTDIVCDLFDEATCRCSRYERRTELVPDCVKLTPDNLAMIEFMPPSCAYRLLFEGKPLPAWHPLRTGSRTEMEKAGHTVAGCVVTETACLDDPEEHVVEWPLRI